MINLALSDERVLSEQIVLGLFYSYKLCFKSTFKQNSKKDASYGFENLILVILLLVPG